MATNGTVNTSFFQLVAAFFVAFVLAHITTKYLEGYERFPSPLVTPGPGVPAMIQGRDYIPHRFKPSPPPGPAVPFAMESDAQAYETAPPQAATQGPLQGLSQGPTSAAATRPPNMPYAMTNDDFLSFITPENSITMSTLAPLPPPQA